MTRAASRLLDQSKSLLAALHRWAVRWQAYAWLVTPLVAGLVTWQIASTSRISAYAESHAAALTAPRFVREGQIVTHSAGRSPRQAYYLYMADGSRRSIPCVIGTNRSFCLSRLKMPIRARVTLFDYRGIWMILSVTDRETGRVVVAEAEQLRALQASDARNRRETPEYGFWFGVKAGLFAGLMSMLFDWLERRRRKRAAG
jgi:hypothetical protein